MVALIVVLVVAVVVVGSLIALSIIKRDSPSADRAPAAPPADDAPLPMLGLESALAQVTDRTGRPIRDAIDAETAHVDDLRVPDDTGPLLRRALDHVSHHDGHTPAPAAADGAAEHDAVDADED